MQEFYYAAHPEERPGFGMQQAEDGMPDLYQEQDNHQMPGHDHQQLQSNADMTNSTYEMPPVGFGLFPNIFEQGSVLPMDFNESYTPMGCNESYTGMLNSPTGSQFNGQVPHVHESVPFQSVSEHSIPVFAPTLSQMPPPTSSQMPPIQDPVITNHNGNTSLSVVDVQMTILRGLPVGFVMTIEFMQSLGAIAQPVVHHHVHHHYHTNTSANPGS